MDGHPSKSRDLLYGALGNFAQARDGEKPLEQLQRLLSQIETAPLVMVCPKPIRVHSVERRLGADQVAALLRRYSEGTSAQAVASEFGTSVSSVVRLVRKHGGHVHGKPLATDVLKQAGELYATGLSVQRVALELRVPKTSLLRAMKNAGIQLRPPKH